MDIDKSEILKAAIDMDKKEREEARLELQPNWPKWQLCEELKLREAILLAMNIDPSNYSCNHGLRLGHKFAYRDGDSIKHDFNDLLDIAERAVMNKPAKLNHVGHAGGQFTVKNYDFARWWKSIGRTLPEEFPENEPEPEGAFSFDPDSDTYPPELDIAFQVWWAVAINGQGGEGNPKARIKAWLDSNYPNLSAATKERISTVCNWDKAGGNKSSGKGV